MAVVTTRKTSTKNRLPLYIALVIGLVAITVVAIKMPSADTPPESTSSQPPPQNTEPREAANNVTAGTIPKEKSTAKEVPRLKEIDSARPLSASKAVENKEEEWRVSESNRLAKTERILKEQEAKYTVFTNPVDNALERVTKKGFGMIFVPPRVDLPEEEILAFLNEPVEIYDDDDSRTVRIKEDTAFLKLEALDFIKAGGTFNQYLRESAILANEDAAIQDDVKREMRRILNEEGPEAAQSYLDEENAKLAEQGIRPVKLPAILIRQAEKRKVRRKKE